MGDGEKALFSFAHNGKTIFVYLPKGMSSVFYRVGSGGSSRSAGLTYNSEKGWFKSSSGKVLMYEDAEDYIRDNL